MITYQIQSINKETFHIKLIEYYVSITQRFYHYIYFVYLFVLFLLFLIDENKG